MAALEAHPDLTATSKRNYVAKLRAARKYASQFAGHDVPLTELLLAPHKYAPLIKRWYPNTLTHRAHFTAVLAVFRHNREWTCSHPGAQKARDAWASAFQDADKVTTARYEANQPSMRQTAGYVPYADLIKKRDTLPEGSLERLLLGLYTHLRPARAEYARVRIYRDALPPAAQQEPNYILIQRAPKSGRAGRQRATLSSSGTNKPRPHSATSQLSSSHHLSARLVLRQFKTSKHHAPLDVPLPPPLLHDLTLSLEAKPRDWVFVNANEEPYSTALFSAWAGRTLGRLFGRPLTISLIRHAYINTLDFNALTVAEKRAIADDMMHTPAMQDMYRLIFKNSTTPTGAAS